MLTLKGTVVAVSATTGGKWHRVMLAGTGRVNDLLMLPAGSALLVGLATGDDLAVEVRPSVETDRDGRRLNSVVFWPADEAA